MKSKSEKYFNKVIGDSINKGSLKRWPLDKIIIQHHRWKHRKNYDFIWIQSNDNDTGEIHSGISIHNINEKTKKRKNKINKLFFYIILPPYRNYKIANIKKLILRHHTLKEQCLEGIAFANKYHLTFSIISKFKK